VFTFTKQQSRVVAVGILGLFFLVVFLLLRSPRIADGRTTNFSTSSSGVKTDEPRSQFSLKNFSRSEVKNGKKIWEVKAALGEYFSGSNSIKLTEAVLWLYPKENGAAKNELTTSLGNGAVVLSAKEATLSLQGTELVNATVSGNVKIVYNEKVTLTTETASYDKTNDLVTAHGEVTITGEAFNVTGELLEAHVSTRDIKLNKNVKTVLLGGSVNAKK